jgi:hypothetical protein
MLNENIGQAVQSIMESPLIRQIVSTLNPDPAKLREAIEATLQGVVDPEHMSKTVRYLWELADVSDLGPEEVAVYVGVSSITLQRWFQGVQPSPTDEGLINAAIPKILVDHPLPEPGTAWWGKHKLTPEEIAADEVALKSEDELLARIAEAGAKLKASVSGREAECLAEAWSGFVEVAQALHERKIRFSI